MTNYHEIKQKSTNKKHNTVSIYNLISILVSCFISNRQLIFLNLNVNSRVVRLVMSDPEKMNE